jgi:hypothetical protein
MKRVHNQWISLDPEEYRRVVRLMHTRKWQLKKQIQACKDKLQKLEATLENEFSGTAIKTEEKPSLPI